MKEKTVPAIMGKLKTERRDDLKGTAYTLTKDIQWFGEVGVCIIRYDNEKVPVSKIMKQLDFSMTQTLLNLYINRKKEKLGIIKKWIFEKILTGYYHDA